MLDCIVIGDLHLDGMRFLPNGNELIINEVRKAEAYAIRNEISTVIYVGDISDKPTLSYDAHERLLDLWGNNQDLLTRHIIIGNHDFSQSGKHSLTILKKAFENTSVHIHDAEETVEIGGVPVNFLPYPYPKQETSLDLHNALNISHFEVNEAKRDNGSVSNSKTVIPENTRWVMGHLHTPQDVGKVHYVGTLFQRNFGESLPKSFSRVKARIKDGKLQVKYTRIPNKPAFELRNCLIEKQSDLDLIPNDPSIFCKLLVSAKVHIPADFLAGRPNCIKLQLFNTKSERAALINDTVIQEVSVAETDVFSALPDYLERYHPDLSKEETNRLFSIVSQIQENL